jgi:hypothetical protein
MAKTKGVLNYGIDEIRNLGAAICYQAVKDYCNPETTKAMKQKILKDLRGGYLNALTNGTATVVAEQLEINEYEIKQRIRKIKDEEVV